MRDTVVEMQAVLGSGDVIASGARVVKSVAGFDVHRLLTGSLGTLGVITRVALKVRPIPRVRRTIVTSDGGLALAVRLLEAVWAPAAVLAEPGRIVVHLEGWPAEVAQQEATVRALAACEVTDDPVVPGVGLFPDMTTVIEGGVTPSRLVEATRDLDTWRAAVGVGSVWVGWPTTARSRRAPHRLDAWVQCRSEDPAPTGHRRTPLEERVRATCDPRGILSA
jgi:FAD/FMN-containing dehydrogenase